jgi:hypothetical protein
VAHQGRKSADRKFLVTVAGGATVIAAARRAGISRRTAQRRLANPKFQDKVRQVRARMFHRATGALAAASFAAVHAARRLLKSKDERTALAAARMILEFGPRHREADDLEARLAVLEARLGERYERHRTPPGAAGTNGRHH